MVSPLYNQPAFRRYWPTRLPSHNGGMDLKQSQYPMTPWNFWRRLDSKLFSWAVQCLQQMSNQWPIFTLLDGQRKQQGGVFLFRTKAVRIRYVSACEQCSRGPGWLSYIDYTTHWYGDCFISQYKDPGTWTNQDSMAHVSQGFGSRCSCVFFCRFQM